MDEDRYSLSDLTELAGVSARTVRYYIAEGLLPPPALAGSRSYYTDAHRDRLQLIGLLKDAYLPLKEIRRRLAGLSDDDVRVALVEAGVSTPMGVASAAPAAFGPRSAPYGIAADDDVRSGEPDRRAVAASPAVAVEWPNISHSMAGGPSEPDGRAMRDDRWIGDDDLGDDDVPENGDLDEDDIPFGAPDIAASAPRPPVLGEPVARMQPLREPETAADYLSRVIGGGPPRPPVIPPPPPVLPPPPPATEPTVSAPLRRIRLGRGADLLIDDDLFLRKRDRVEWLVRWARRVLDLGD